MTEMEHEPIRADNSSDITVRQPIRRKSTEDMVYEPDEPSQDAEALAQTREAILAQQLLLSNPLNWLYPYVLPYLGQPPFSAAGNPLLCDMGNGTSQQHLMLDGEFYDVAKVKLYISKLKSDLHQSQV